MTRQIYQYQSSEQPMSYLQKPSVMGAIFASLSASMIGLAWYHQNNKKISETRFNHLVRRQSRQINKEKIILAFDPQNLFIQFSEVKIEGYKLLKEKSNSLTSLMFKPFAKKGYCYQEKVPAKDIRNFIKKLKEIDNFQIVIYTKIQEHFCNQILQNIGIQHYFPHDKKYFMKTKHKSPQEIDQDTGRVIIVTANHEDQKDGIMSCNHNLILSFQNSDRDQNFLFRLQKYLQRLASFGRTDSLHDQMYHLALQMGVPLYNYQSILFRQ